MAWLWTGFSILLLLACTNERGHFYQLSGKTMGTTYSVKFTSAAQRDTSAIKNKIEKNLVELNRQMSTYIKDSEISQFNQARAGRKLLISDWFASALQISLQVAAKTGGYFDPTIGPLVNIWGFGPEKDKSIPGEAKIQKVLKHVGFEKVQLQKGSQQWWVTKSHDQVYLDLSASAKGFGVDVISNTLQELEISNHLVEIGGEMKARGKKFSKPWRVAIEKPDPLRRSVQQVIHLQDMALATSGSYRNFFASGGKTYSHTIDRKTGKPIEHGLLSVSVIKDSCIQADALATALMSMGPERALKYAKTQQLAALFVIARGDKAVVEKTVPFRRYEVTR